MRNGSCVKCSAETVFVAIGKGGQIGLKTDRSEPFLNIYKDNKWIPDINLCRMDYYVCRNCGYFEMFVNELNLLEKLNDCDNWKKIEAKQTLLT